MEKANKNTVKQLINEAINDDRDPHLAGAVDELQNSSKFFLMALVEEDEEKALLSVHASMSNEQIGDFLADFLKINPNIGRLLALAMLRKPDEAVCDCDGCKALRAQKS